MKRHSLMRWPSAASAVSNACSIRSATASRTRTARRASSSSAVRHRQTRPSASAGSGRWKTLPPVSHETWVLDGLRLLNHPLRADQAAALMPKSLDMLLEVHRTGALFFDANWMRDILRGHSSPRAAAAVSRFIDDLPADYPPRLRALILQSSDLLMRAAHAQAP